MAVFKLLCAGAAQAVAEKIIPAFELRNGVYVEATYDAVHALKARLIAGEAADVAVLTAALIDELTASGVIAAGSRADLGKVDTGVAVKAGISKPDVSEVHVLRENIRAVHRLYCPDPQHATAGKVVMGLLDTLGIMKEMAPRLSLHPNGYAAMAALAASAGTLEMGITQVTEIRANPGVALAGLLPGNLRTFTLYSAGVGTHSAQPALAKDFVRRLTGFNAIALLVAAGYQVGN